MAGWKVEPDCRMIQFLANDPTTPDLWETWLFHHRLSHDAIRRAILAQKRINLTDYQIYPVDQGTLPQFLQNNSQLHIEMDALVGALSADLESVDFKNDNERKAWIWEHYLEHQTAEAKLGIAS